MSGWPGLEGIADGIPNLLKVPYDLGTKKFWAASDELFDRFMSTQRAHVDELRELVAATGGPPLLGTPASLVGLERWFLDVTSGPFDDGADWAPTWTVLGGKANKDTGLSRDVLVRMQERVAIYYADVLIDQLPGSQWVCWRDTQCNTPRSGKFTLDIGVYPGAARPIWVAEQVYRDNSRLFLDQSLSTYIPP
ncbi:MAG: hypothetical protein LBD77_00730 [Bifidobacteriaceae bacterium]|nr:hypothetical protein [Bifidobacteriaceae bacterium]